MNQAFSNPHRDKMIQHMDEIREVLHSSVRRLHLRDVRVIMEHLYEDEMGTLPCKHLVFVFHPILAGHLERVEGFAERSAAEDCLRVFRDQPSAMVSVGSGL